MSNDQEQTAGLRIGKLERWPTAEIPLRYYDMDKVRCETCRHWDVTDSITHYSAALPDGAWGVCRMTVYGPSTQDVAFSHPESAALARDHEDYAAELMTRPDFGCVQWESRDATPDR